jgi:predicted nucleotidyltransferase
MSVLGFSEASQHAIEVLLPGQVRVSVASPPALLILKLIAWKERHWSYPRYDAVDIRTLLDSYSQAWNEDRLYEEADDLLRHFGFNNTLAGAALLGRDGATIAKPATLQRIQSILQTETSEDVITLATDMGRRVEDNLNLLQALFFGIQGIDLSRRRHGFEPR